MDEQRQDGHSIGRRLRGLIRAGSGGTSPAAGSAAPSPDEALGSAAFSDVVMPVAAQLLSDPPVADLHPDPLAAFPANSPAGEPQAALVHAAVRQHKPGSHGGARFHPGDVIAGRYRIVSRLGAGGMGEVYRADDLRLDVPVALKFVSPSQVSNVKLMTQFYNEVRIARDVTHANVCRVFDIGEAYGQPYISMEFVDGDDLNALLRRVGRYTRDRGLQVAYQLCAGLSAAHAAGVLHRDLKPHNVMIDRAGHVRITDFGLAVRQFDAVESIAGTPAYMAPEQWRGEPLGPHTDIYALGLILYELFVGRRAYMADGWEALRDLHLQADIELPSESGGEPIDPQISRVIRWCLKKDPAQRPKSVQDVLAALPGGDPIRAALAAAQTPSPDAIARAGHLDSPFTRLAPAIFVALLLLLATVVVLSRLTFPTSFQPSRPPAELTYEARMLFSTLGYADRPADETYAYTYPFILVRAGEYAMPRAVNQVLPADQLTYWYRAAGQPLVALDPLQAATYFDPPMLIPGMVRLGADVSGRLMALNAVPTPEQLRGEPLGSPDPSIWAALFRQAGLNLAEWQEAPAGATLTPFADREYLWVKAHDPAGQVSASTLRGCVTRFEVHTAAPGVAANARAERIGAADLTHLILILLITVLAALAWRNLRTHTVDTRGALRFGLAFLTAQVLIYFLNIRYAGGDVLFHRLVGAMAYGMYSAGLMALAYMAIEPHARRYWPHTLISWQRLLRGQVADPIVGRDLLVGLAMGALSLVAIQLDALIPQWRGLPPHQMLPPAQTVVMDGGRPMALAAVLNLLFATRTVLGMLAFLTIFTLLFRGRRALAFAVVFLFFGQKFALFGSTPGPAPFLPGLSMIHGLILATIMVGGIVRVGLLASIVCFFTFAFLMSCPITSDLTDWHAALGLTAVGMIAGAGGLGLYWMSRTQGGVNHTDAVRS